MQDADKVNLAAAQGVAVREFILKQPHPARHALRAQYYLGVNGRGVQVGRDLSTRVRPGETVRVEVTAGSHTVVSAYRVAASP